MKYNFIESENGESASKDVYVYARPNVGTKCPLTVYVKVDDEEHKLVDVEINDDGQLFSDVGWT